jgi:hypothetical protein
VGETARGVAKGLPIRLLHGGSHAAWLAAHGLAEEYPMLPLMVQLERELRGCRREVYRYMGRHDAAWLAGVEAHVREARAGEALRRHGAGGGGARGGEGEDDGAEGADGAVAARLAAGDDDGVRATGDEAGDNDGGAATRAAATWATAVAATTTAMVTRARREAAMAATAATRRAATAPLRLRCLVWVDSTSCSSDDAEDP